MIFRKLCSLLCIFTVLSSALFAAPALAFSYGGNSTDGLFVDEGLMGYNFNFNNSPTGVTSRTFLSSETGIGYIIGGWFYLGGDFTYSAVNETTTDTNNTATNHQETYIYYGPTVGYMSDNWFFLINYFASAEKKDIVTGAYSANYDNTGTGFGLNLGYRFNVANAFDVAPVIAYKNINYVNCKNSTTGTTSSCSPTIVQTEFTPYVTLMFNFK